MSGSTQAHLYVTHINSTRLHFIKTIELIMYMEFLKTHEIEVLKIENLKFWKLRIF